MAQPVAAGPPRVTIELRMAFSLAAQPGVARWSPQPKPVRGATVTVRATGASAVTNRTGRVTLALAAGANQVLEIEPAAAELSPGAAATGHGGGGFAQAPSFLFRPFEVEVDIDATGFVLNPAPRVRVQAIAGVPAHALLFSVTAGELVLDWKPDWIKSNNRAQVANKANEFLVIHRTGGASIGSAINTFTNRANATGIHYLVDVDGHVVKLVHESDRVNHTGPSFWQRSTQANARSVGIEIVHTGNQDFPAEQYTSLLRIVPDIRATHAAIVRQRVVGHSDIAVTRTNDLTLSTRRIIDPGETFDWDRLEAAGHARRRLIGPPATTYNVLAGQTLRRGQTHARGPGGPNPLAADIRQLQTDLLAIGYSVANGGTTISGVFDDALEAAVKAHQQRYFSGGNRRLRGANFALGVVDFETATSIQAVLQDT